MPSEVISGAWFAHRLRASTEISGEARDRFFFNPLFWRIGLLRSVEWARETFT